MRPSSQSLQPLALLGVVVVCWACLADTAFSEEVEPSPKLNIVWDRQSMSLVQPNGFYGRIIRLRDRTLICGFESQRASVRRG